MATKNTKGETMKRDEIQTATIDQLQDELAAAGFESTSQDREYLVDAVTALFDEYGF